MILCDIVAKDWYSRITLERASLKEAILSLPVIIAKLSLNSTQLKLVNCYLELVVAKLSQSPREAGLS